MYEYKATVEKVIDGDTVILIVDLGFYCYCRLRIRLENVSAPEMDTSEGLKARAKLQRLLPTGAHVTVRTRKTDKYGRYVGIITNEDNTDVNQSMLDYLSQQ